MEKMNLTLLVILFVTSTIKQNTLAQDAYSLLFSECGEEQTESFEERIIETGIIIEPELMKIVSEGPSADRLKIIKDYAGKKYEERKERLKSGQTLTLSERLLNLVKEQTKQEYVQRRIQNYIDGMIKQALTALGILGSEKGLQLLRNIKDNKNSRYSEHTNFVLIKYQK